MPYDLQRPRLRGLIERIPRTRRFPLTQCGLRAAPCFHRIKARLPRPAPSVVVEEHPTNPAPLRQAVPELAAEPITLKTPPGRRVYSTQLQRLAPDKVSRDS